MLTSALASLVVTHNIVLCCCHWRTQWGGPRIPGSFLSRGGEINGGGHNFAYHQIRTTDNYFCFRCYVQTTCGFYVCSYHDDQPFCNFIRGKNEQSSRKLFRVRHHLEVFIFNWNKFLALGLFFLFCSFFPPFMFSVFLFWEVGPALLPPPRNEILCTPLVVAFSVL